VVSKVSADSGRCPAEYLAAPIAHGSCNYECKEWQALRDGRIRNALSVRTCIRACTCSKAIPWLPLCTGCCSVPPWRRTLPSSRIGFWSEYGLGCVPDALVLSILSPGGKISHHGRPRFCIGTRSQLYFDLWRKRVRILRMTRTTALVLKFDIPTVSVLQGSQVAPELSMSLRIRPRFKRLHTYMVHNRPNTGRYV
jgi:hypothetical protein